MSTMNVRRTVAITALFVLIFTFCSPLLSVAAASFSKGADPCSKCCSSESNRAEKEGAPYCSSPCCPILLCISVHTPQPYTCSIHLGKANINPFVEKSIVETPILCIFKPPKKF